ncbi:pentatricopeptide repeat-containing protein At5g66520-like [Wolffia australiana]
MKNGHTATSAALRRCQDTQQLKKTHAALLVHGHPSPASSPSLIRSAFSHAALHPSGDLHYAILLLFSLSSPPRFIAASRFLHNTLIRGLARQPRFPLSISSLVYKRMLLQGIPPSSFTFTFLFQACASCLLSGTSLGVQLHCITVKTAFLLTDVCVRNSLIRFYSDSRALQQAKRIFEEGVSDVVSWNSIIDGCLNNGDVPGALLLFDRMPERNSVTWNSVLAGLVKNERLDAARSFFEGLQERNIVSWTVMISGYVQNGRTDEALRLFQEMQRAHRELNTAVLVSALLAVTKNPSLSHGLWIHAYAERLGIKKNPSLSTAIIAMYSNCGRVELGMQFFRSLKQREKDESTYTAAIFGLAVNSHGWEALNLFQQMRREGLKPDRVSYLAVLTACNHAGCVELGFEYFNRMVGEDGIEPELDHYACMVDLLGRGGRLKEAEEFVSAMPLEPDNVVWGALLNACRIHGNAELGRKVGEFLIESDGNNEGRYVSLSNIFAECKNSGRAEGIRAIMRRKIVERVPGLSCIEVNGVVREFVAGENQRSSISRCMDHAQVL